MIALAALSVCAGAATGAIVATFKRSLEWIDRRRSEVITQAHHWHFAGFLLVIMGCAAAVAVAAWLVRRFSTYASGSGVPEVEAALAGILPPARLRHILLIKYVGGLLSIGSGMATGPEGPGVQMGAVSARLLGATFHRSPSDVQALVAAGAGAGIAVAFNAPIAGAIFVLEELVRRFEMRVVVAGLGASSTAILISRLLLGNGPDLHFAASGQTVSAISPLPYAAAATWPLYLALGVLAGIMAIFYNRSITGALSVVAGIQKWPIEAKAASIGALVGAIGWFGPDLIGNGDNISQRILANTPTAREITIMLVARFCLGPISYAARTPGGLFAPLLAVGALLGALLGCLCQAAVPTLAIEPQAFAVVGMAAFFAAVVRSPVTGIVLVIEMTAAFATLLPMLVACFAAMVVTNLLHDPPIYVSLYQRFTAELDCTGISNDRARRPGSAPNRNDSGHA